MLELDPRLGIVTNGSTRQKCAAQQHRATTKVVEEADPARAEEAAVEVAEDEAVAASVGICSWGCSTKHSAMQDLQQNSCWRPARVKVLPVQLEHLC
eukprot:2350283-Rhodomonas_salina.1